MNTYKNYEKGSKTNKSKKVYKKKKLKRVGVFGLVFSLFAGIFLFVNFILSKIAGVDIWQYIQNLGKTVWNWISGIADQVVEWVTNTWKSIWQSIGAGIKAGLKGFWARVWSWIVAHPWIWLILGLIVIVLTGGLALLFSAPGMLAIGGIALIGSLMGWASQFFGERIHIGDNFHIGRNDSGDYFGDPSGGGDSPGGSSGRPKTSPSNSRDSKPGWLGGFFARFRKYQASSNKNWGARTPSGFDPSSRVATPPGDDSPSDDDGPGFPL